MWIDFFTITISNELLLPVIPKEIWTWSNKIWPFVKWGQNYGKYDMSPSPSSSKINFRRNLILSISSVAGNGIYINRKRWKAIYYYQKCTNFTIRSEKLCAHTGMRESRVYRKQNSNELLNTVSRVAERLRLIVDSFVCEWKHNIEGLVINEVKCSLS